MARSTLLFVSLLAVSLAHAGETQKPNEHPDGKSSVIEISPGQYVPSSAVAVKASAEPKLHFADGSEAPAFAIEAIKFEDMPMPAIAQASPKRPTKDELGLGGYIQALFVSRLIEKAPACETLHSSP